MGVRVGVLVSVGLGVAGHPLRAAFTAAMISSMVIWSSWFVSPAGHSDISAVPRAMFTIVSNSSTVTCPLPLQSPTQEIGLGDVGVGVGLTQSGAHAQP